VNGLAAIVMCGLPASGKTTTAARLQRALGGRLIRSCDVYADLGISLPDWVRATNGFTERVTEYARLRDAAYHEMARRLAAGLGSGASPVVVDAVHGEPDKRAAVYAVCRGHGASPVLVWCRCDDVAETERRIRARRGHEHEPEQEAADVSVLRHLRGLWRDPTPDSAGPLGVPLVAYDTISSRVVDRLGPADPLADLIGGALTDAQHRRSRSR
jgi:predicted kinase